MNTPMAGKQGVHHPLPQGFTCIPKEEVFHQHVAPRKMRVEQEKL